MNLFLALLHALFYTDTSFLTFKAAGFSHSFSVLLAILVSSVVLFIFSLGSGTSLKFFSRRYKTLEEVRRRVACYLNLAWLSFCKKLGIRRFPQNNKIRNGVNYISWRIVEEMEYLGIMILSLIPFVPFLKEAAIVGGQLLNLKYTVPLTLFFNAFRLFVLYKIFF